MALRTPCTVLCKRTLSTSIIIKSPSPCSDPRRLWPGRTSRRLMATATTTITAVPPVTQDSASSKGPTAMVFMNMGGPATTDQVGPFLSRLFVILSMVKFGSTPVNMVS